MSLKGVTTLLRLAIAGAVSFFPAAALADRIDGEWCRGASSFTIEGPYIPTPHGNRVSGEYTRHSFYYVGPRNEPDAGAKIAM